MPDRTLGQYRITYSNGVVQVCDLITQYDYEDIVKPYKSKIEQLEILKMDKEAAQMKRVLKNMVGDNYFTDGSPIYQAMETGILVLPHYTAPIKVEKISFTS